MTVAGRLDLPARCAPNYGLPASTKERSESKEKETAVATAELADSGSISAGGTAPGIITLSTIGAFVMTNAVFLAAGLVFLSCPVLAQSSVYNPDSERMERRDALGDGNWRIRSGREEGRRTRSEDDDDGPKGGHRHGHGGGARFMFRSGDTQLSVKCDNQESMRSCVDAAITLMERARSLPTQAPAAPASPSGPGANPR